MAVKIQTRGDTEANWTAANSVLADREMGLETDTVRFKFGDGATAWNSLGYASDGGGLIHERGAYDATANEAPSTGGSGVGGAIKQFDWWFTTGTGSWVLITGQPAEQVNPSTFIYALQDDPTLPEHFRYV